MGGRFGSNTAPEVASLEITYERMIVSKEGIVIVKITSKRQVTFPARVLDALGVSPGDQLELEEGPDSLILRPRHIGYARLGARGGRNSPARPPLDDGALRRTGTASPDTETRTLDLVTVNTGHTTSWNRDEIYGPDGR